MAWRVLVGKGIKAGYSGCDPGNVVERLSVVVMSQKGPLSSRTMSSIASPSGKSASNPEGMRKRTLASSRGCPRSSTERKREEACLSVVVVSLVSMPPVYRRPGDYSSGAS